MDANRQLIRFGGAGDMKKGMKYFFLLIKYIYQWKMPRARYVKLVIKIIIAQGCVENENFRVALYLYQKVCVFY